MIAIDSWMLSTKKGYLMMSALLQVCQRFLVLCLLMSFGGLRTNFANTLLEYSIAKVTNARSKK